MLRRVAVPGAERLQLTPGVFGLWGARAVIPAALGYAVFDVPSPFLPSAGSVEVELSGPLDGRPYLLRRALDVPEHWQVVDVETGWLATGTADTPEWLRANLEIADGLSLADTFREHAAFSVPVTIAWLLEEPERREAKLRQWLRTQRYPEGLEWLGGVQAQLALQVKDARASVTECEAVDGSFDRVSKSFDVTRRGSLAAAQHAGALAQELEQCRQARERLEALQPELDEVRQGLRARRLAESALTVQVERWEEWQTLHERAQRSLPEHEPQWRAYQEACAEIDRLTRELASIEAVRIELQNVAANALALRREQTLLEGQLALIGQAESAAADLAARVEQQRQMEQQIAPLQERALRLEVVTRALQQTIAESKRNEVLLLEVEHQIEEIEQARTQVARIKKLQNELDQQQELARDAARQVDHVRFLETAIRAVTTHLDDLRKGASATERLAIGVGAGNGGADPEQRTIAGHLREAIDHQMEALERQIRDWQMQSRDMAGAPAKLSSLRATVHQLEQEIESARGVEVKLGGLPALKQHRKYLAEHVGELKKTIDARIKEQQECSDAPARLAQLRQDLSGLQDPRSQQQALLRSAARKHAVESELRQVQRRRADAEERQKGIEERLAAFKEVQEQLIAQERRRDESHDGYCSYLTQQAIAELSVEAGGQLDRARSELEAQRKALREAEARETALVAEIAPLRGIAARVSGLEARLEEGQVRAAEWKERYQASADRHAAAEANRAELARRRTELAARERAARLLDGAVSDLKQAQAALGGHLRRELAEAATRILQTLTGDEDVGLAWAWREAPALRRGRASRGLGEVDGMTQSWCALAIRLALAAEASRFRTVYVSDLGALREVPDLERRLARLGDFQQFLLPAS
ncbi:MAG TPA: hypothetical protein VK009_13785 [Chloroflexota bacterium]|nr:hypothetical protein [Chloroflexota bacterium]